MRSIWWIACSQDLAAGSCALAPPVRMERIAMISPDIQARAAGIECAPAAYGIPEAVHEPDGRDHAGLLDGVNHSFGEAEFEGYRFLDQQMHSAQPRYVRSHHGARMAVGSRSPGQAPASIILLEIDIGFAAMLSRANRRALKVAAAAPDQLHPRL